MDAAAERLDAELYDARGIGWPGELDFYQAFAAAATARGEGVLEIACGAGRIALALAGAGAKVTAFDLSPAMLAVAREQDAGGRVRWLEADMRAFDLGERFGLIIVPGHSFQFMLTAAMQLDCLAAVRRHLTPDGVLVLHLDHQDLDWLGGLPETEGVEARGVVVLHPATGRRYGQVFAWTYERPTQTAPMTVSWVELDAENTAVGRWQLPPMRLHCAFRMEIEHLLARAGFAVTALYGDFAGRPLDGESAEMLWVARPGEASAPPADA